MFFSSPLSGQAYETARAFAIRVLRRRRRDRIDAATSVYGTFQTCCRSRLMSVVGGRADRICSQGVFRIFARSGSHSRAVAQAGTRASTALRSYDFLQKADIPLANMQRSASMITAGCERLGIEVPIIQAPMGGAVGPALAAAVSNAGGLGTLALWGADIQTLRQQVRETRALTAKPFAVNLNLEFPQEERLDACLQEGVPVISFFWCEPSALVNRAKSGGAIVLHTVSTAAEARHAVECGVDVVIAQGWEAGGHVRGKVATMPLIPAVVDAVGPVPVIAAGGIADGRGLAAALALGASGAWIGTRFLASNEVAIHPHYRERIFQATEDDTVYLEELFDIGWPKAPHRVLRNSTVAAWEAAGRPATGRRPGEDEVVATSQSRGPIVRYRSYTPAADAEGDIDALPLWAGQSVALVHKRQPAAEIVREIDGDAQTILLRLAQRLGIGN
jgi:NAD(P)H-dependent flavin oxidoreductase YrpB (nitropropane dioxygenase family)